MISERGPTLVEAAPWIEAIRGETVVVKLGGELMNRASTLRQIAKQVAVLHRCGARPILVHGAGVQVDEECRRRGIPIVKHGGRRVTTPEALEVLIHVLTDLNQRLGRHLESEGLSWSGLDQGVHRALQASRRPPREVDGTMVDFGEVGDIQSIDASLLAGPSLPVLPSLGMASDGPKNINADSAAAHVAIAVGAVKLVYLTVTPGVMRSMEDAGPISRMSDADARQLIDDGIATAGMKAKLEEAQRALQGGVSQVHIIAGRDPYGLLRELYTAEGIGTLITRA